MNNSRITLRQAEKFHGHLGPYLILGILSGEFALKKLRCKKFFGLNIKVKGANKKPKSCLVDGLQLSTGATYGKGNIKRLSGNEIKIEFYNLTNHKKIILRFKNSLIQILKKTRTHRDSEFLARQLYKKDYSELFNLTPIT